jgi:ABC-type multidrug transport system ATPase subunit
VLKGITARGERKAVVDALLQQTNLWSARKRKLGTFSGGMRQRFGIAQALLGDPKLIIVDEPTAGLDPEERNRFLNLLAEIGENVVVILSTHIVADVSDLCSRTAILGGGRVLATGAPRDVVDALAGRVWERTVPKSEVADWSRRLPVLSTRLVGGATLLHVYSEEPLEGFSAIAPDLEDVYFLHLRGAAAPAAA